MQTSVCIFECPASLQGNTLVTVQVFVALLHLLCGGILSRNITYPFESYVTEGRSSPERRPFSIFDLRLTSQIAVGCWELLATAVASTVKSSDNEAAATYQMSLEQSEVAFGFPQLARNDIAAAIQLAPTRDTRALAANVMALTGNIAEAEKIATDLARENPVDTNIAKILVPTIRASIELQRGNPEKVVEFLRTVTPYDLGSDDNLYSGYLRGRAFLMLGRGTDAAREFQKQLDHRPIYQKNERAALCQLGLARSYALQGDSVKTRAASESFFTLWKDGDPDIPILQQAKIEFAKLN